MPMRDTASATRTMTTTQALGTAAGTVVQATPFDLGSAQPYAVPVSVHVYYPANPTGTSPTIIADVTECATPAGTYTALANVHTIDNATTGFPKEYHQQVTPRLRYMKVAWTIAGTTPAYGTAQTWLTAQSEERRVWP